MTPQRPSRMDGYIRVSRVGGRVGESFISPDQQRAQIETWAQLRGVEVLRWHEDLDQSGGKLARPGLEHLLERIEQGETEGVIVAKLDRLSRLGVGDALKLVERITEAGGSISAVDLGIDPTTAFGEFGMTIMLAMARMERRRLMESWDDAKERAIARGIKISPTPFGYDRLDDGTIVPNGDAPLVAEAFRLAARDSVQAAVAYLLERSDNRVWTTFTVRRLLANRTYLGEVRYGDLVKTDTHEAIVTPLIFEAAQSHHVPRRRSARVFPLSGFATCAACGGHLVGGNSKQKTSQVTGTRIYRCSNTLSYAKKRGTFCPDGGVMTADLLEAYCIERLKEGWDGGTWTIGANGDAAAAQLARDEARAELDAFASDLTLRRALGDKYHEHLRTRVEAVERAEAVYREAAQGVAADLASVSLDEVLESAEPDELERVLRGAFEAIVVRKGRGLKPAQRVRLIARGGHELPVVATAQDG